MRDMTAARSFFVAEADMLSPLALAADVLADGVTDVVFEVAGVAGVPDLVLVEPDTAAIEERGDAGTLSQPAEVAVMLALAAAQGVGRPSLTAAELADRVGVGQRHLASRVLTLMADRGHVHVSGDGWSPSYRYRSVAGRLVTVEAKLRDWRRGFGQATRHAAGVDRAWLAVDATAKDPALRGRPWFTSAGVGLACVSLDGAVEVLIEPSGSNPYPERRELLAERAVGVLLSGRPSSGVAHVFGREQLATTGPDPRLTGVTAR